MGQQLTNNFPPFVKLIFALFITVVVFLVFMIVGVLVALPVFSLNVFELQEVLSDFDNINNVSILKYFQIVQTLGLFVVPPFVITYIFHKEIKKSLYLISLPDLHSSIKVILVMIIGLPVINLLVLWNAQIDLPQWLESVEKWMKVTEQSAQKLTEMFLKTENTGDLFINLLMIAILPALGEEFLFRGVLQRYLIELIRNRHLGVLVTSILFSALHLQFFGFFPRLLLGLFFGYLLLWTGNIWLPVLAHFINNGMAVILYFILGTEVVEKEINPFGTESGSYFIAIVSAVLVSLLIVSIYRENRSRAIE